MFDKCIYFNLNALVRDLNKVWEEQFSETGLTPPLGYLLALILKSPGLSQKEVGAALNLDRSTITRFLESLEKEKLVRRETSTKDGRVINVYPTKKAEGLKTKLEKAFQNLSAKVDKKLASNDVRDLLKLASKVRTDSGS